MWTGRLHILVSGCLMLSCMEYRYTVANICDQEGFALVTGDHGVDDDAITASSMYNTLHSPAHARLNMQSSETSAGGWCTSKSDSEKYIQVEFDKVQTMCRVQTQGRDNRYDQWVKQFHMRTSKDCNIYTDVTKDGSRQNFIGNTDSNTVVTNDFAGPVRARCVRIYIDDANKHPCMRFELIGVEGSCTGPQASLVSDVPDSSLTSSSEYSPIHSAKHSRLNTIRSDTSAGAWCAGAGDDKRWIQVKFDKLTSVCGIRTQGRTYYIQYTTQYSLQTSRDCQTFTDLKENGKIKVFSGNSDAETVVNQALDDPAGGVCFRIVIIAYKKYPCLRFDLLGQQGVSSPSHDKFSIEM